MPIEIKTHIFELREAAWNWFRDSDFCLKPQDDSGFVVFKSEDNFELQYLGESRDIAVLMAYSHQIKLFEDD